MINIFIGRPNEEVKEAITSKVSVHKFFKTISELHGWITIDSPSFSDRVKVLVTPGGFSKNVDFKEQVSKIDNLMSFLPEGSEVIVILNDNSKYIDVVGEHLISHEPQSVLFMEKYTVGDLVDKLTVEIRPEVKEPDYVPKEQFTPPPRQVAAPKPVDKPEGDSEKSSGFFGKLVTNPFFGTDDADATQPAKPKPSDAAKARAIMDKSSEGRVLSYDPPVDVYKGEDGKNIIIVSLFEGCGSTTVAMNVCAVLSMEGISTSLVEYPENLPTLYDYLNARKRVDNRWSSLVSRIVGNEEITKKDYWKESNVTWFPMDPNDFSVRPNSSHINSLFKATDIAQLRMIDASSNWRSEELQRWYRSCDEIWVVVKPDVIRMRYSLMDFKTVMAPYASKVRFIGNSFDSYSSSSKIIDIAESMLSADKGSLMAGKNLRSKEPNPWEGKLFDSIVSSYSAAVMAKYQWVGELLVNVVETSRQAKVEFSECAQLLYPDLITNLKRTKFARRMR